MPNESCELFRHLSDFVEELPICTTSQKFGDGFVSYIAKAILMLALGIVVGFLFKGAISVGANAIANAVNCYSRTEDTLGNVDADHWLPGKFCRGNFWAFQEVLKGTKYAEHALDDWQMNSEGGWGYNPYYANRFGYVTHPNRRMTARFRKAISKLTDDDLKRHPVFKPFNEDWLFTTNCVPANAITDPMRSRILADGIPATSFAAGANPLTMTVIGNIDYASCKSDIGWPRKDGSWRHSDIKNVAFMFVEKLFKMITERKDK